MRNPGERLTALHTRHARVLLTYLAGFGAAGGQSPEDLLQETMIRVWNRIGDLPERDDQARRWLFAQARDVGLEAVRTRPGAGTAAVPAAADITETVVEMQTLRAAVGDLSRMHQRILVELYLERRSIRQAARRLGVPVGTAKSRAFYAMKSLREAMLIE
ncbi:RNA polymerase sigma factor SigL [Actinoplanes sp. OR16]|uniref:sigma-70 family RNA polymerase sigma factor n=1 Tax=Actinoplanes sp. OR16 TaxID=946334 RepID=UPI000F6D7CC3|nr:sigma-70 family RNA polymerase sigma factor [Actinoplanes sp. OR16]BBH68066.1 RNA polymerase sigma factor SigL [Actinoplanes sp. OR16]